MTEQPSLLADVREFVELHRPHGEPQAKASAPTPNGYRLEVACRCNRGALHLPNHHIYMKLMIDGVPSRPFSATTLPPTDLGRVQTMGT